MGGSNNAHRQRGAHRRPGSVERAAWAGGTCKPNDGWGSIHRDWHRRTAKRRRHIPDSWASAARGSVASFSPGLAPLGLWGLFESAASGGGHVALSCRVWLGIQRQMRSHYRRISHRRRVRGICVVVAVLLLFVWDLVGIRRPAGVETARLDRIRSERYNLIDARMSQWVERERGGHRQTDTQREIQRTE